MDRIKPVIVAIGYNRIEPLNRLLTALEAAHYPDDDITLIISLDFGGGNEIRKMAEDFQWSHGNKIVRTFEENQGLIKHISQCGDYSMEYGAAIVLEDDILPAPYFYEYVVSALEYYKNYEEIFAIALYSQQWNGFANRAFNPIRREADIYLSQVVCSWGQCFIGERWKEFRKWFSENQNVDCLNIAPKAVSTWEKSLGKYLIYYIIKNNKYYVTPYESLSTNCHRAGTHISIGTSTFQVPLLQGNRKFVFTEPDNLVKYDTFFESLDLKRDIESKYSKKVCVDYYGLHSNYAEFDLCFSSEILPYKVIESYGLEMRPPELNYYYNISGEDLFLYDIKTRCNVKKKREHHYKLLRYEVKELHWIESLFYSLYEMYLSLIQKK